MKLNVEKTLAQLKRMSVPELKQKYEEVWREPARSPNKPFLIKRIIWRMQSLEEGTLSERAPRRAAELANEADLRLTAPRPPTLKTEAGHTISAPLTRVKTSRLPMPGAMLTRQYKDRLVQVKVLPEGFEYEGESYKSLSAVARKVTGTQWNGYLFFGLAKVGDR